MIIQFFQCFAYGRGLIVHEQISLDREKTLNNMRQLMHVATSSLYFVYFYMLLYGLMADFGLNSLNPWK